ncbi:putative THUMP domain protein [Candidatus Nitrososphaera gargensis Ga9.2]|uniref:Putative THUMP domain protein n=1 Tax=Nitrososphaera gargensis (strain Ga9.2) TaxID=1237085 RepID=K0IN99_NITGG|nr:THUMP domain-containing protein [Candidatus Nitrososphaera gargensis]AFU59004.1 putative THUMP domain protein [Candidatus Nitrososphaera gargensis Ga9.2]
MANFNLIVSTSRFSEEEAQDEILDLLDMFGDPDAESEITEIKGLLLAQTALDPFEVIEKLKELIASEPWEVRYILRVLPVERVVPTELDAIRQAARDLAVAKIGNNESFRITVEKRHSALESIEVIKAIAGEIESKVDLENPSWIVLVEIIGGEAGLSVLRPEQIFSSVIEKRK